MENPFFTVLVTAQDPTKKHYLIEALQSALNQDFIGEYEIILVKDYYDDEIEKFVKDHRKIKCDYNGRKVHRAESKIRA